jgi:hypothetical protein
MEYETKQTEWHVKITERKTGEVIEDMKCQNEREAVEVMRGAMINGNSIDFKFAVVEVEV